MRMTIKQSNHIKAPEASASDAHVQLSLLRPTASVRAHPHCRALSLSADSKKELHDVGSTWARDGPTMTPKRTHVAPCVAQTTQH